MGSDLDAVARLIEEAVEKRPELSLRELSRRVRGGKAESWLSAFISPPPGRQRQMPDIDTLQALSRELDIPLYKLVEPAYGIDIEQLYREMQTVAGLSVNDPMAGLTVRDQEKVRDLIALVRTWSGDRPPVPPRRPPGRKHRARREDGAGDGD